MTKVENTILRQKCLHRHIVLTITERQKLIKYGLPLGGKIKHLISIVHYSTFRRWIQESQQPRERSARRGRPRILTIQIRELLTSAKVMEPFRTSILPLLKRVTKDAPVPLLMRWSVIVHMARHNKWGYTKILGELKKLMIKRLSRGSVKNILKEYGIVPFKVRHQLSLKRIPEVVGTALSLS